MGVSYSNMSIHLNKILYIGTISDNEKVDWGIKRLLYNIKPLKDPIHINIPSDTVSWDTNTLYSICFNLEKYNYK